MVATVLRLPDLDSFDELVIDAHPTIIGKEWPPEANKKANKREQSESNQRAIREQSESNQRATREHRWPSVTLTLTSLPMPSS